MSRSERVEMLGVLAGVRDKIVEAVEGSRKAIIGGQINRHPKRSVPSQSLRLLLVNYISLAFSSVDLIPLSVAFYIRFCPRASQLITAPSPLPQPWSRTRNSTRLWASLPTLLRLSSSRHTARALSSSTLVCSRRICLGWYLADLRP
jgi:hypothetical protein